MRPDEVQMTYSTGQQSTNEEEPPVWIQHQSNQQHQQQSSSDPTIKPSDQHNTSNQRRTPGLFARHRSPTTIPIANPFSRRSLEPSASSSSRSSPNSHHKSLPRSPHKPSNLPPSPSNNYPSSTSTHQSPHLHITLPIQNHPPPETHPTIHPQPENEQRQELQPSPQTRKTFQKSSPPPTLPQSSNSSSSGPRNESSQSKPNHHLHKITGKSIPKIKRVSSKVFGQLTQSFHSSSDPSNLPSSNISKNSLVQALKTPPPRVVEPNRDQENLHDYDPITPSDTRSFEDDGQEGSLQDALDLGDPNSFPSTLNCRPIHEPSDGESHLSSAPSVAGSSGSHRPKLSPSQSLEPGIQHGALACPNSPSLARSNSSPPSHQSSISRHRPISPTKMTTHHSPTKQCSSSTSDHYLSVHPSELARRVQPLPTQHRQSREPGLTIIPAGPVPLPSRLSGWFQNAFSTSSSHLPLIGATPSLLPPHSPEKLKASHQSLKKSGQAGNSTPPDDQIPRLVHLDSKRSPNNGSHFSSSNMRGLGNFFDKAVNYMFDTDAHSYDSRMTADLWIIGGQRFSGVWKPEEVHEDGPSEDHLATSNHAGTYAGLDAIHPPLPHPKKRSGLRRVTVGKTKSMFKHHTNPISAQTHNSPPNPVRRSVDLSMTCHKNISLPPSSTSSPEPSVALSTSPKTDDPTLLPASVTHSYPPSFYHAFASVIGLTYRTDFPPIPCSDRSKSSAISAAGTRVGGMLASLSMSIGRTGKKTRSGQGGSRSPSPRPQGGDDEDRTSESAISKGLTTDVGWGCMLRTGQSLLANALLIAHLGRDWRRPVISIMDPSYSGPVDSLYSRLLSWFIDSSSPLAPFSVHRFASKGKELGKEVGEWFGPSTAAGAIKALTNGFLSAGLGVATDVDGTVYRSDVYNASALPDPRVATGHRASSSSRTHWQRPVLVLINVRLGLDGVNPAYYGAIKATFTFPQSVGIAGGRPSSSYYFCGYQDDSLFYIDPHHPKPTIPLEEPTASLILAAQKLSLSHRTSFRKHDGDWEHISSTDTDSVLSGSGGSEAIHKAKKKTPGINSDKVSFITGNSSSVSINLRRVQLNEFYAGAYPDSALRTFHPEKVRRMNLSSLDPSMLLGFLVKDEADWEDFTTRIRSCKPPLFHIADVTPSWMRVNPDPAYSRDSVDLRPSDDSDLGIDSWSEHEDWDINDRADDMASSLSQSQPLVAAEDHERCPLGGSSHDEEFPTCAEPMGIDDEGWDDLNERSVKVDSSSIQVFAGHPSAIIGVDRNPNNPLHQLSEFERPPRVSLRGSDPLSHARAYSVNAMPSLSRGIDTIHSHNNPYRHSFSITSADDDDEGAPAETSDCHDTSVSTHHRTKPPPVRNMLTKVFPTSHQLVGSTSISPIRSPPREEPRTRNVSAATVRAARHSEEEQFLADSEEHLNHGQRRRLDSQGSSRALRT